jgi:phospholipid-transporting ATPase
MLGLCHTVLVDEKEGCINYNASSPDELSLVNAGRYFGFMFTGRDEDNNMIIKCGNMELKYKLLDVIEFTSARKKMSVIVKTPDNKIIIMCKGADSFIQPLLANNSENVDRTLKYLEEYAKEGLRTLLLAEKEVDTHFYK